MSDDETSRLLGHALRIAARNGLFVMFWGWLLFMLLANGGVGLDRWDKDAMAVVVGILSGVAYFIVSFARRRRVIRRNPLDYVADGRWYH